MTIDKILHHVSPTIIDTINFLAKKQESGILSKWLTDCKAEISRRESEKENTYPLYHELAYLQNVLGGIKC